MAIVRYNVDMVRQQYSPVCWLACATMLIQYKRRITPTAGALGISGGADFREPQTVQSYGSAQWQHMRRIGLTNARSSELHLTDRTPSQTMIYQPIRRRTSELHVTDRTPSQNMIYQQLKRNGPFILHHHCGSFWYGPNVRVPTSGGHSVLVVGTDTNRGCVWFNNPWGTSFVMTTTQSIVGAIVRWERNGANKSISYM